MRRIFVIAVIILISVCIRGEDISLSTKELAAARKLYNLKCLKCHKDYPPASYAETEWHEWMVKMRKKARLKTEQYELLLRYTDSIRASNTNTPATTTK